MVTSSDPVPVTRTDVMGYARSLDPDLYLIYRRAEDVVTMTTDTLSETFQVASEIEQLFWRRAREKAARGRE